MISIYKPTTPSRRFITTSNFSDLAKKRPEKKLLRAKKSSGGRNNFGRITVRFRGGGHKRLYRIIDFKRDKREIQGRVHCLEYDPNRTCRIALIYYKDGEKRYILAPDGIKQGDEILASLQSDIKPGNALPLKNIPPGTVVHNVELKIGAGGKLARSAGSSVQILGSEGNFVQLRLPSGETRLVHQECWATVGQVGNLEHENIVVGKAGRNRWLGFRPHNRGVSMNPVDHPMGGGEGKSSGGRHPVTPWGKKTKGKKTRNCKRTDRMIVRRKK